jgi:transcription elongation factor Elf1
MKIEIKYVGKNSNIGAWGLKKEHVNFLIRDDNTILYKDINVEYCPFCKNLFLKKTGIGQPGNGVIFECEKCKKEFQLYLPVKIIQEEDDYWEFKFKNILKKPNISRNELEDFVKIKIDDKKWKELQTILSFCSKCDNEKLIIKSFKEDDTMIEIICTKCKHKTVLIVNDEGIMI